MRQTKQAFLTRLHGPFCVWTSFPKPVNTILLSFCIKRFKKKRKNERRQASVHGFPRAALCCAHYLVNALHRRTCREMIFFFFFKMQDQRISCQAPHESHIFCIGRSLPSPSVAWLQREIKVACGYFSSTSKNALQEDTMFQEQCYPLLINHCCLLRQKSGP